MDHASARVRKNGAGFPVLVYEKSDVACPVPLYLIFRSKEGKATLCFRSSEDPARSLILQYDPDHLLPGTSLRYTANLPQSQLATIERPGVAKVCTLYLRLRRPCTTWYPRLASIPPQPGLGILFNQLVNLAAATELEIVFDYRYVGRAQQASFKQLIEQPESLCGFPVNRNYTKQFRRINALEYKAIEETDANVTTDDEQAPPPYNEASAKRERCISTTPTPSYPPSKRVLLSSAREHTPASSTVDGSIATPRPRPQPLYHGPALALRENIFQAVQLQLPAIVDGMLPGFLIRRLSTPSPTSASFQPDCKSPTSQPPPSPELSCLGEALAASIAKQVKQELQSIYSHAVSYADHLCSTANDDVWEAIEEQRLDIVVMKDDVENDINRIATYRLEELREQVGQIGDDELSELAHKVDEVCDNTKEHLDKLRQSQSLWIQQESLWLEWKKEVLKRDTKRFEDMRRAMEPSTVAGRGGRAQSASL